MVGLLFDAYKSQAGRLGKDEYRDYLRGIGAWGSGHFTDEKWSAGCSAECEALLTTAEAGVDLAAFTRLYTKHRAAELQLDFRRARVAVAHLLGFSLQPHSRSSHTSSR